MGVEDRAKPRAAIVPPLCRRCQHFCGVVEAVTEPGGIGLVPVCKAFPRGIPRAIREGKISHRIPYPGDCGITYTPGIPG